MKKLTSLLLACAALLLTYCGGNKPAPEAKVEEPAPIAVPQGPSEEELLRRQIQELVQQVSSQTIYFDYNQSSLTSEAKNILNRVSDLLQEPAAQSISIRIEGHTDAVGSEEYNLALGERRAQIVMEYLEQTGSNSDNLSIVSFGEEQLAIDSEGKEPQNRRAALSATIQ